MKTKKDKAKLASLREFISSYYGNDLAHIQGQLLETIYMLHYIDPGCFGQQEVQEKSFLLFHLAECLGEDAEGCCSP